MDTPFSFGADNRLRGILSTPSEYRDYRLPTIVIPNAYVTPHVGLFRMHVELSRSLAKAGFRTLRFDVSGIGDSSEPTVSSPYTERIRSELREAINFVCQQTGNDEVILVGHCDGANRAFELAAEDERVRSVVCIDGYMQISWRTRINHFVRRLRNVMQSDFWKARLARGSRPKDTESMMSLRSLAGQEQAMYQASDVRSQIPSMSAKLRQRGTRALWIFSAEYSRLCNLNRLRKLLQFGSPKSLDEQVVIAGAKHVYPEVGHRRELIEIVTGWLAKQHRTPA